MLIILSPAKTLDYAPASLKLETTLPAYVDQSAILINSLKTLSPSDLSHLMGISDNLATLNAVRFASWSPKFSAENSKAAVLAFNGDVYEGLDAKSLSTKQLKFAQQHLRILSGLYGVLKPLDLMQPYRLEMGTSFVNARGKDLYAFWAGQLTEDIKKELSTHEQPFLINLASDEYFKVIQSKSFQDHIISPAFLDEKDGKYKIISFYAKKARGLMARFMIEKEMTKPSQLKQFKVNGYAYCADESTPNRPVFKRSTPV